MAQHFWLVDHIRIFLCHSSLVNREKARRKEDISILLAPDTEQIKTTYAIASIIAFSVALGRMALAAFASFG